MNSDAGFHIAAKGRQMISALKIEVSQVQADSWCFNILYWLCNSINSYSNKKAEENRFDNTF
jgi:hypothetical protein